ncbi:hypothetical protein AX16_010180 [Volvariella volvacea WC 439]|nr:hypothetical protein AX16_010180 [Volvariella volvacea WC 439]
MAPEPPVVPDIQLTSESTPALTSDAQTDPHLLSPYPQHFAHSPAPSTASSVTFDGRSTEPLVKSSNSSHIEPSSPELPAASPPGASKDKKDKKDKKGKKGKGDSAVEMKTNHELELQADAETDPTPFLFKPYQLAHMLDPKSYETLERLGGTDGIMRGLGSSDKGLSSAVLDAQPPTAGPGAGNGASSPDDPEKVKELKGTPYSASRATRLRVYGENSLPRRRSKSLLELMWLAMKDKVLILLSAAAVISLALGFYQDFGLPRHSDEPPVDWVEGVAIVVAILIVVLVGSLNDWQKERQFRALNEKKDERQVKVLRDGTEKLIDVKDVLVGDICIMDPGEIIPCDGIFLSGSNVKCDESGATGESDAIKKVSYERWTQLRLEAKEAGQEPDPHTDCFIISGSKVLEGVGQYLVVAVGTKSFNGRIMMALRGDTETTPLQLKLNRLAETIAKIGASAGGALFTALMIRYFVELARNDPPRSGSEKGMDFVDILIIAVTLIVVAVPEGLPLAVTLALAFATKRMTRENLLVRVLGACETMANASVVCTDKTGTLTTGEMTVVAGTVGLHCRFIQNSETNHNFKKSDLSSEDFEVDLNNLNNSLSPSVQTLLNEAISINSTGFEDKDPKTGEVIFVGNQTETAFLRFIRDRQWPHFQDVRNEYHPITVYPFSSKNKYMAAAVKIREGVYRLHAKGASEVLFRRCNNHVLARQGSDSKSVEVEALDDAKREKVENDITFYASQALRTLAVCYRDFETPTWPPATPDLKDQDNNAVLDYLLRDLTLIGIVGIQDPIRPEVPGSVARCDRAGVDVKMCTGDNLITAKAIALRSHILKPNGVVIDGPTFRGLSSDERLLIIESMQVLARSSPEDKKVLVETLKSLGKVVGVTGDGTNDGPALKAANVGFSMGIGGTEVAKEASEIILMDDNFASIVKAIMWGRCVNDAVRKFLQFQISTNVTAVVITFVTAVASDDEESVLTAVQLLWINIIMDTFAALALATDPASESLLDRLPESLTAPLFSIHMLKMILLQSVYQITVIFIFHFLGHRILGLERNTDNDRIVQTLVFNAFVFAQIFNSVNCRRLDNKYNIFEGIIRNWYFIAITCIEVAIQVLIVFVGGAAFQVTPIGGREWGISIALGVVSIPLGALIRTLPNGPFIKFFTFIRLLPREKEDPTGKELGILRGVDIGVLQFRGGRAAETIAMKPKPSRRGTISQTIIASSIIAGAAGIAVVRDARRQQSAQAGEASKPESTPARPHDPSIPTRNIEVSENTDPNSAIARVVKAIRDRESIPQQLRHELRDEIVKSQRKPQP